MPLSYREFSRQPPTVLVMEWGIPGSCGEELSKLSGAFGHVVSTGSTTRPLPGRPTRKQSRHGLDTRSLALAARTPEGWRTDPPPVGLGARGALGDELDKVRDRVHDTGRPVGKA